MKISIITPSYNQSRFIRQTIESVISQDWREVDYIVVEGGSTDNSYQIADEYAQKGLLKLVYYSGSSQAQAINKGFEEASGDVFAWLNSDDIYLDHALRRVVRLFLDYPEADVLYGHELSINESEEVIGCRITKPGLNVTQAFWHGISIPQPTVFFRKRVYDALGGLDESFEYSLDTEYWYRMIKRFKFIHLPQVLAATRFHKNSKTGIGAGIRVFGQNYRHFYREGVRAFLAHGGSRLAPYYLQNRVNRYCGNSALHWILSRVIRNYGKITDYTIR